MNSFIENVNYVANLDSKFGSGAILDKNNLSLRNETHNVVFTLTYYDKSEGTLHSMSHTANGITASGFSDALIGFRDFIIAHNGGTVFTSTASSSVIDFVINNVVDFEISVNSLNDSIKLYEIGITVDSVANGRIYDVKGEILNPMSILPKLAMIGDEVLLGVEAIGQNLDAVNTVADNIVNVVLVGEDIESVVLTGSSIANVNTVSANIANVNSVALIDSEISIVSGISSDVSVAASLEPDIQSLASIASDISTVSGIALDVSSVAAIDNEVIAVSGIASAIGTVSAIASDVSAVSLIDDKVVIVANSITSVETVSDSIANVNIAGNNIADINIVVDNIASIVTDSNNIGNINIVAEDLNYAGFSNIDDMGSILDPVEVSPSGTSLIETVANNIDEVSAVGVNIDAVIVNAQNIVDIQNAEENAIIAANGASVATEKASEASISALSASGSATTATTKASEALTSANNALASEELAHKWSSEPEDVIVAGSFGIDDEYSAYHWAKKAELFAGGSVTLDSLADVDTTGVANGDMIRYDSTLLKWIPYDFTRNDVIGFDTTNVTAPSVGQIAWNADEGTADLGLNGGSVLQIGQENTRTVRNDTASTIENGTVVMFAGTIGNSGRIKVAPYTGIKGTHNHIYGIATQTITSGSDGLITIDGKVRGINTTGSSVGEVWNDEDILYAKPNDNGRLTNVEPGDSEIKIVVASVIKSHTNGTLEVRVLPIDENLSYTKEQSDTIFVPLEKDFILDLGGL